MAKPIFENITFAPEVMKDGFMWWRVCAPNALSFDTLDSLRHCEAEALKGFEFCLVYDDETDSTDVSLSDMMEHIRDGGRIGLYPEARPEPKKPLEAWVLTRTTWHSITVQARDYNHAREQCEIAEFDSATGYAEFNVEAE